MQEVVFDIEVFPEWWCIVHTDPNDMSEKKVITSDMLNYMRMIKNLIPGNCLIGFNIKKYDLRILNGICHSCDPSRIYELSKNIIEHEDDEEDYGGQKDPFNNYGFWNRFNFSDLYDDWRFGSLKSFESNIGMSIKESDISFDKTGLTNEEKEEVIRYCKHDVDATVKLLECRREYIDSKKMLSEMFNIPLTKALKSTNAKLCAIVLEAESKNRTLETKFIIPQRVEPYLRNNLPDDVIQLFEYLNNDSKVVRLFDNEITFGIGGIHSTYSENIVTKSDEENVLMNIDVTLRNMA